MRILALLLLLAAPAFAQAPGATAEVTPPEKTLGIGYKLGNGIGFLGGDVIVHPIPHLTFDLYGTYFQLKASTGETGSGWAAAPAVQYHLFAGQRSSPYAALGMQYVHLAIAGATGDGYGGYANVGYEWKWRFGLGIQLGAGVQYLTKATATSGQMTITTGGQVAPNLELGVRYMFF